MSKACDHDRGFCSIARDKVINDMRVRIAMAALPGLSAYDPMVVAAKALDIADCLMARSLWVETYDRADAHAEALSVEARAKSEGLMAMLMGSAKDERVQ